MLSVGCALLARQPCARLTPVQVEIKKAQPKSLHDSRYSSAPPRSMCPRASPTHPPTDYPHRPLRSYDPPIRASLPLTHDCTAPPPSRGYDYAPRHEPDYGASRAMYGEDYARASGYAPQYAPPPQYAMPPMPYMPYAQGYSYPPYPPQERMLGNVCTHMCAWRHAPQIWAPDTRTCTHTVHLAPHHRVRPRTVRTSPPPLPSHACLMMFVSCIYTFVHHCVRSLSVVHHNV